MSISQLRSMLADDQWDLFVSHLISAGDGLSIIRDLSGSEADEIRDLWDALHIIENLVNQIHDLDDCDCDDDDCEGNDDD